MPTRPSMDPGQTTATDAKRLQNPSQLLLRHLEKFQGSSILVAGYLKDDFGLLLKQRFPESAITLFNFDYAAHRNMSERHASAGLPTEGIIFDSWYAPEAELHDVALVFLPKSRALIEMTLNMVALAVQPGARVFLVGENNAGIRSSRTALEQLIGEVTMSDSARHCVVYLAQRGEAEPERRNLDDWVETFRLEARGLTLEINSLPGVFSHGQLDAGTRFLLEKLEVPSGARVLDFGCGTGVIGLMVKRLWPQTKVDMVDTNALALESSRRTMQLNNLTRESIWPSDVFSDVNGLYTRILSNPPFHTGVQTDYHVVENFLKNAAAHLEKKGALTIVANRFLKYRPLIEKHVGVCREIAENRAYRIYEGVRS